MKTVARVRAERRQLAVSAYERWKAYQANAEAIRGAKPNRLFVRWLQDAIRPTRDHDADETRR